MNTTANRTFTVPTRDQVSENNQAIFDNLHKMIGFVPNLYAYYAHSETALNDYLALQNRKSSLNGKQREIINLVTSQINDCRYCQSAHSVLENSADSPKSKSLKSEKVRLHLMQN